MYRDVPGMPLFLCSVHSMITWMRLPFFAMRCFEKRSAKVEVFFEREASKIKKTKKL
jgi:hypothetical protein